jgi:hypothetical protein
VYREKLFGRARLPATHIAAGHRAANAGQPVTRDAADGHSGGQAR